MLPRPRRKASPILNPITSTTPHVSFGRRGGIPAPFWMQRPSRPAPALPTSQTMATGCFTFFLLGKRLQPSSQSRHLCHTAGPWQDPEGAQSPPSTATAIPLSPHKRCPLAGCPVPLGLPLTDSSRIPLLSWKQGQGCQPVPKSNLMSFHTIGFSLVLDFRPSSPVFSLNQVLSLESWFRGPCLKIPNTKKMPNYLPIL